MTSPASAASSSRRCSAWTASSRRSPASRSSSSGQSMSGGGSGPVYVEGRIGLRGLAGLYAEAFGRLRRSAHLRASYLFWIALGLAFTELGRALDPAMDSLFFGTAAIGSTLLGIIPRWLMALLLFRYLAPLLATPIVFLARRRPELVYTVWGRRNTALTGVAFFVLMLVRAFYGPVDAVAIALGVPLLATTTVLHFVALAERTYHAPLVRERRRPG